MSPEWSKLANFFGFALLIVGTAATLAAFGGKTWEEGPEPILERVTFRGWVSLACLVLAFVFGACKQSADNADKQKTREDHAKEKIESQQESARLHGENQGLQQQLLTTNQQLSIADQRLGDISGRAAVQVEQLNDARATLAYLRTDQQAAREDVTRSGSLNLIAAMASGDRKLVDFDVAIPLTKDGTMASDADAALLPAFKTTGCQERTYTTIRIAGGLEAATELRYQPGDRAQFHYQHASGHHGLQAADQLLTSDALAGGFAAEIGQRSQNGTLLLATLHDTREAQSGAELLAYLLHKGFHAPDSSSNSSYDPSNPVTISIGDTTLLGANRRTYPVACGREVYRYYQTAFQKAYYGIRLSGEPTLTVYFRLTAKVAPYEPVASKNGSSGSEPPVVRFWIEPTPYILPGDSSVLMRMDWQQHVLVPPQSQR